MLKAQGSTSSSQPQALVFIIIQIALDQLGERKDTTKPVKICSSHSRVGRVKQSKEVTSADILEFYTINIDFKTEFKNYMRDETNISDLFRITTFSSAF